MTRLPLALFLMSAAASMAAAADLTITIKGVHSDAGSVLIAVYDSESSFMKPRLAKASRKAKAAKGEVTFVIPDLPAGKYAVASYHDENDNGKLDTDAFGIPNEGYGFSNNATGFMGPARYSDAAFDFDGKTAKSIALTLNY
jgi:uncharacterized protein (DUF2141 family)